MDNLDLIQKTFFGRTLALTAEEVVVTNIKNIFTSLTTNLDFINKTIGHFEMVTSNSGKKIFLRVPPGPIILDALKIIKETVSTIHFVGYAGSLDQKYSVGSLVKPGSFMLQDNPKTIIHNNSNQEVLASQLNTMLEEITLYEKLKSGKVTTVDMESYMIADYCTRHDLKFKISLIISDLPLTKPFYAIDSSLIDLEKCKKAILE